MSSGKRELEAFIERVESLATLNQDVAKAAAPEVADVVRENVTKGVAPDGEAWPERKGGGKALAGAGAALSAASSGNKITLTLAPPFAFHNWGSGGSSTTKNAERARKRAAKERESSGTRSKFHAPRRQILPEQGEALPTEMREAIEEAAERVFRERMGT